MVLARANGLGYARLAMAVPKKRFRTAVLRNRLRRIIRESFRHHLHELAGKDIMIMVHIAPTPLDADKLRRSLQAHWRRLA